MIKEVIFMKLIRLVKKVLNRNYTEQKQQDLRDRLDFAMSQSKSS